MIFFVKDVPLYNSMRADNSTPAC